MYANLPRRSAVLIVDIADNDTFAICFPITLSMRSIYKITLKACKMAG